MKITPEGVFIVRVMLVFVLPPFTAFVSCVSFTFISVLLPSVLALASLLLPFRSLSYALVLIRLSALVSISDPIRNVWASLYVVGESIHSFRCFE